MQSLKHAAGHKTVVYFPHLSLKETNAQMHSRSIYPAPLMSDCLPLYCADDSGGFSTASSSSPRTF